MTRGDAYALLCEHVGDISLRRHCLSVEAAMRAYARKLGHDEETWGVAGLLHDFDYERWPTPADHPLRGSEILRAKGYPEEVITCILSHADYLADRYPRRTAMEKGLYACDEITGLITATALLRPTGIGDLTAASVKKKMKTKGFAKGVNRDDVVRGAADFGVDLGEHIQFVIDAMKAIAAELGLEKTAATGGSDDPG
ncbi:MAG: HDIG domain-containing protein [Gemmataceae bacterium]